MFHHNPPGPAIGARRPVPWRLDFSELVECAKLLHPLYDEIPCAIDFIAYFAFTLVGTPAGSIHQAFGTPGYGTDAPREVKDAVAASRT